MATQADLYADLQSATLPTAKRDLALELLNQTNSRQYLDTCLFVLKSDSVIVTLDDAHRGVLREKALYYFEDSKRDKAGMLRESITRLLVNIDHPDDKDIYLLGVATYYLQPVDDVAQNLRAVALAGLSAIDLPLASLYAVKLIGEEFTSVFNCEPAMTAVDVLVQAGNVLPIYQFLLTRGLHLARTRRGEVVGKALESLGNDFPTPLYLDLIEQYQALDEPVTCMGIISNITTNRLFACYDALEDLILATHNPDLRRYGLVMMAAERDDDLAERLMRMARLAKLDDIRLFIEAVEVCNHPERDDVLAMLQKRVKK